jgi:hypothetical protein
MDLVPLDPPDLARLEAEGEARMIRHGPVTLQQVLGRAWAEMAEQEQREERQRQYERAYQDWLHGRPVKIRHPRRTLRKWLSGR